MELMVAMAKNAPIAPQLLGIPQLVNWLLNMLQQAQGALPSPPAGALLSPPINAQLSAKKTKKATAPGTPVIRNLGKRISSPRIQS
ncbi:hypothetical protein B9Z55_024765 [Caenorhabditis nigoni]|uniref:Uncharacterized protein n=1 Tax=Caenorhabditis nigoni TaxID=1611254 RepID=A0A2G5SVG0_9PELO|nr:hypothetical protein B9Z55_024765 [Caenorhabditis nigoni]